jgi:beta-galactosidase
MPDEPITFSYPLSDGWYFHLDPTASMHLPAPVASASPWEQIQVPHTWQSLGRTPGYSGVAWYQLSFEAPDFWKERHVRIEFEAVTTRHMCS